MHFAHTLGFKEQRMIRRNLVAALLALLATAAFSGSATAHGGAQHGARALAASALSANHTNAPSAASLASEALVILSRDLSGNVPAIPAEQAVAYFADAHGISGVECPGSDGQCCSYHCCTGTGLPTDAPDLRPAFASEPVVLHRGRPPADTLPESKFRPPCR